MRIAFDLDGTLIASAPHIHHALSLALEEMGHPSIDLPTVQGFIGRGLSNLVARAIAHLDLPKDMQDPLAARTLHHFTATPSDPANIFSGVLPALSALKDNGHSLSICTNKPYQAALIALRETGLQMYFDLVVGGGSLPHLKPAPDMLTACAPDLFIGDSDVDAATAEAAQIPFFLYTEGYRHSAPEDLTTMACFSDYADLPTLVAKHQIR